MRCFASDAGIFQYFQLTGKQIPSEDNFRIGDDSPEPCDRRQYFRNGAGLTPKCYEFPTVKHSLLPCLGPAQRELCGARSREYMALQGDEYLTRGCHSDQSRSPCSPTCRALLSPGVKRQALRLMWDD